MGWKSLEEPIVDLVGDKWCRKLSEVLLEGGGNSTDIKIWIRDVVIITALEAFFDSLDLGVAARFAVDTFDVHA